MKSVFILKSKSSTEIVSEVYETDDYWLVPVTNTYHFEFFDKVLYTCTSVGMKSASGLPDKWRE